MHSLIKKTAFLIALALIGGCSTFLKDLQETTIGQYTAASAKDPQATKETAPPKKIIQPEKIIKLPPLISGGTKPLRIEELIGKVDFPPDPKDDISPCIDPKTGKEKNFLLADLRSELIPLSYSNMEGQILSIISK